MNPKIRNLLESGNREDVLIALTLLKPRSWEELLEYAVEKDKNVYRLIRISNYVIKNERPFFFAELDNCYVCNNGYVFISQKDNIDIIKRIGYTDSMEIKI